MGMPSMPNSKVEVLHYAQTVEGERRACCRALDSEQCGAGRSSHDTLNCSEPLRCATCTWNGQGDRYTGADKRAGACRSHQLQAHPPPSKGCSQASASGCRGIGSPLNPSTRPGTLAPPVQDDVAANTLSGGSSAGSAKEGNSIGTAEASAGEPPQRRRGKRKLPVPDLDAIEDPVELRLQRRLLKNRRTAAASRERKQKEMDNLVAHVQALEADNEKLRQALQQRNAQIRTMRAPVAPRREFALAAALAPFPRSAPPAAAPVLLGNSPLHWGFHASPASTQQPWQAAGSPGQLTTHPWVPNGQPVTFGQARSEPPWHGVGATPWGAAGISRLRGGQLPVAALGPSAGGHADAPKLGQPLSRDCASLPSSLSPADFNLVWSRSLSTSELSAVPRSSFDQQCNQPLCLAPPSSRAHVIRDPDNPSPLGKPTRAMLRVRASSCTDLPPVGPSMESNRGFCPSGQLLRSQSGSYPQKPQHVPVHADNHATTLAADVAFLLPPADPDDLEQVDFYNFWRGLA